jgi:Mg-chelatase subunit ChlD
MSAAIRGAIPIVASVLAGHVNVPIVWGQFETASTDTRTIYLPDLPLQGRRLSRYVYGYVVHEAGHIRHSDFSVLEQTKDDGLVRWILIALEDPRIERAVSADFLGARQYLVELTEELIADGELMSDDAHLEPSLKAQNYLLLRASADLMGYAGMREAVQVRRARLVPLFPSGLIDRVDEQLDALCTCKSTGDVLVIAKAIAALLRDSAQTAEEQSQASDQESSESSEEADEQAPSDTDPKASDTEDNDSGQGSTKSTDAADGETPQSVDPSASDTDSNGSGGCADVNASPQTPSGVQTGSHVGPSEAQVEAVKSLCDPAIWETAPDRGDLVREQMQSATAEACEELGLSPGSSATHMPMSVADCRTLDGTDVVTKVRGQTIAIRTAFEDLLQDMQLKRTTSARAGHRLVHNATTRLYSGNVKLFQQRSFVERNQADIVVLIDKSGSMTRDIEVASQAAVAMLLALDDQEGVRCAVGAFPHTVRQAQCSDIQGVLGLKQWDEGVRAAAGRMAGLLADGGTPLASALLWAGQQLHCSVGRRIVLTITDGQPDSLSESRQVMLRSDPEIEYLGIGINAELGHLFPVFTRISSVQELARTALSLVQAALVQRRKAA